MMLSILLWKFELNWIGSYYFNCLCL